MAHTDEGLFRACGVRIAFNGREGGTSVGRFSSLNCSPAVGDDERAVERNIGIACEAVGVSGSSAVVANQVHGTNLVALLSPVTLSQARNAAARGADGFLVEQRGVAALLNSADCPLVILVSPSGRFALAHAGWRGAIAGIAGKAARELSAIDPFEPAYYNAYIGPHIRSECFEVQEDVSRRFVGEFGAHCAVDDRHVSLAKAISADLVRNGLAPHRIADVGICTKCNPSRYFSYRATGGECGRQSAIAVRV